MRPVPTDRRGASSNSLRNTTYTMPSKSAKKTQKPARKQQLPMPRDSDDSEVDEFETERRQRGMYDDSDEASEQDSAEQYAEDSEDGEGSEAESSEMARQRWQGWQADELDGQEEEFTEESDDEDEGGAAEDSEEEVPRRKSPKTDQDRLASLRKGRSLFSWSSPMHSLISVRFLDLEQVPLAELLKAQRKLKAQQAEGSDSEGESVAAQAKSGPSKNRVEAIKRQLLLLQQKKGRALDVAVPRVQEEYDDSDGAGDTGNCHDGGEGSRNNLWQVRKERKEDREREKEQEEKRMQEREKRKRDGKHA